MEGEEVPTHVDVLAWIVVWLVSLVILAPFLINLILMATLAVVSLITWRFQNMLGKILFAMISATLIYNLTLIWKFLVAYTGEDCRVAVFFYGFARVGETVWLTVINFNFWMDLGRIRAPQPIRMGESRKDKKYLKYSIFTWGVSALCTGVMFGLEQGLGVLEPETSLNGTVNPSLNAFMSPCRKRVDLMYTYVFPVSFSLLLVTGILVGMTLVSIRKQQREAAPVQACRSRAASISNFQLVWKLTILMGATWIVLQGLEIVNNLVDWTGTYAREDEDHLEVLPLTIIFLASLGVLVPTVFLFDFLLWKRRAEVAGQIGQVGRDLLDKFRGCRFRREGVYEDI